MKRKLAAVVVGAVVVLTGACGGKTEDAAPTTTEAPPDDPGPTIAPEDLKLVDVPMSKPAPGAKVEASALPPEVTQYSAMPGLQPAQQDCVNAAMKQALDADPSLSKTPGKIASLGGKAVTVCESWSVVTDPLLTGMSGENADTEIKVKLTPAQVECFKGAFAADKDATAKLLSAMTSFNQDAIKPAWGPFETKCGVKISDNFSPS